MATYLELFDLASSPTLSSLRKRINVAVAIKAQTLAEAGTLTAPQIEWCKAALANTQAFEQTVLNYVLAYNNAVTVAQIEGATDAQVQNAVNTAVNNLLGA